MTSASPAPSTEKPIPFEDFVLDFMKEIAFRPHFLGELKKESGEFGIPRSCKIEFRSAGAPELRHTLHDVDVIYFSPSTFLRVKPFYPEGGSEAHALFHTINVLQQSFGILEDFPNDMETCQKLADRFNRIGYSLMTKRWESILNEELIKCDHPDLIRLATAHHIQSRLFGLAPFTLDTLTRLSMEKDSRRFGLVMDSDEFTLPILRHLFEEAGTTLDAFIHPDLVITSDDAGFTTPRNGFYRAAYDKAKEFTYQNRPNVVFVGSDIHKDLCGALHFAAEPDVSVKACFTTFDNSSSVKMLTSEDSSPLRKVVEANPIIRANNWAELMCLFSLPEPNVSSTFTEHNSKTDPPILHF